MCGGKHLGPFLRVIANVATGDDDHDDDDGRKIDYWAAMLK